MKRYKTRAISVAIVVAVLLASLGAGVVAMTVTDGVFKNNTPAYIKLGTQLTGAITHDEDYEAYMFDVEKEGSLALRLNHEDFMDSAKSGWEVTLYKILNKNDYKELAFYKSFWSDAASGWDETGLSVGTYLITVTPGMYFLDSEFTLETVFNPTTTYEKEPNDTQDKSTLVQVGYGKYGVSSDRQSGIDIDWYAFDVDEDSCVNISFTHSDETLPQVGWTITLINEYDEKITQFTSRLTETIVKTGEIGLKAGRYYVSVEPQTELCKTYTLLIGADKAVNNEFEMNDTPETAINLPHDFEISGCLADRLLGLDKDYFKFVVESDGFIDLTFSHELQEGDKNGWNIRVFKPMADGSYYEIVRKVAKWNVETTTIENLGIAPGVYYVCIDGDSMAYNSATYTVKWKLTANKTYEREPNGNMVDAEPIQVGTYYQGAIISSDVAYDEDFYAFTLTEDTNLCLEFGHDRLSGSNVCWKASVIDKDGNVICSVNSPLNESLLISDIVSLSAGTYYVKVETGMFGSEEPYYFRVKR